MKNLKPNEMTILIEVVKKRQADILPVLASISLDDLTCQQTDDLCQTLTDEFCETGLQPNSEPNKRGILLETIIDKLRSP